MKSISEYYDGMDNFPLGSIKISPSGAQDFFDSTSYWYRQNLLDEDGFQGNTGSLLGNIIHYAAETLTIPTEYEVLEYLTTQTCEYEVEVILANYGAMCRTIVEYLNSEQVTIVSKENFIHTHLEDIVHVGGTYDAMYETTEYTDRFGEIHTGNFTILRDYKSTSQKPTDDYAFTKKYRFQLYIYVYILKRLGITIDAIELLYVSRATKTLPPRIFSYIEKVDDNTLETTMSKLNLIKDSILEFVDKPHLRHLLSQDNNLKNVPCKYTKLQEEEI